MITATATLQSVISVTAQIVSKEIGNCADATVQLNGSTIGTIASGDTDSFPVTQDGSPVGSWNGSAWIVPSCPAGGGSIEVTVSDSSPSIGDTITITATASGFTPDSYLFFAYDDTTNELVFVAEQSSNSFNWTVPSINVGNYSIYVLGVENGAPDVTAFGTVDISVSSSFLLDTAEGTGANFAFAFFRLRAGYTGAAALIRRSSDNAQKTFYFDANNVLSLSSEDGSGTTLSDWITTDDGYLVTGYSQDSVGQTFTASNAADQYQIISNGILITLNGVPCMSGSLKKYSISSVITFESAYVVAKNDAYNGIGYIISSGSNGISWGGSTNNFTNIFISSPKTHINIQTSIKDLLPHIASFYVASSVYVDGALAATGSCDPMPVNTIGVRESFTSWGINGKVAVIVGYGSDNIANRTSIESNIDSNFTPSLLP